MPLTDALGFLPDATSTVALDESGSLQQATNAIRTSEMTTTYRRSALHPGFHPTYLRNVGTSDRLPHRRRLS